MFYADGNSCVMEMKFHIEIVEYFTQVDMKKNFIVPRIVTFG